MEFPAETFEGQHGIATVEQLSDLGFTTSGRKWLVESGRCEWVSPRLLRVLGAPRTKEQRLLAAVLDAGPGSALSHTSALAWWRVPGFVLDELHVTHARDGVHRPRRLADHIHDKVLLPEHHVRVLERIPVVTPSRALFDLAGLRGVHPRQVERAVDNAWKMGLVSGKTLHAMLREMGKRGRPGIGVMREILVARGPDYVPPASGLEHRVIEILEEHEQAPLRRQVDTGDEDGWIGRIDFADAQLPFRLEVQSERFHSSLLDQQADAERIARLEAAGFVVATVTDIDVWHRPRRVVEVVREGRREAVRRSAHLARSA